MMKLKNTLYFIKYKFNILINLFIKLFNLFYSFFLKIRMILLISLIIFLLYKLIPLILESKIIIYNSNINFIWQYCGLNDHIFSEIFKFVIFIVLILVIYYIIIKVLKYFSKLSIFKNSIYIISMKYISYFIYYIYTESNKSFIGFFLLDPEGKKKILLDILEKRNIELAEADFNKLTEFINSLKDINETDLVEVINKLLDLIKPVEVENTTKKIFFWVVIAGVVIIICMGGLGYIISNYEIFKPRPVVHVPSTGIWGGPIVDSIRDNYTKPSSSRTLDGDNNTEDLSNIGQNQNSLRPVRIEVEGSSITSNEGSLIPKPHHTIISLKNQDTIEVDVNVLPPGACVSHIDRTPPKEIIKSPIDCTEPPLEDAGCPVDLIPFRQKLEAKTEVDIDTTQPIIQSPSNPNLDEKGPNLINLDSTKFDIYPNSLRLFLIICIFFKNTYKYFKKK